VPDWVVPAAIPQEPPAAAGASTVDLLSDVQKKFTKDGDASYYLTAYKIASAQGLDDAALQINWDPALETLTIHHYRIVRDGKVLDLLGDGSKLSVLQREQNMENAALDGELTASMQPADVRVGDVIEVSFTRTRRDPAMGGMSEALIGPNDGTPFGRFRLRFIWPDGKKMRWRALPGILQPKLTHNAGGNELIADVSNVTTPIPPRGAPARFLTINAVDISEFSDWRAVSDTILPFYAAAAELKKDSPVRVEAEKIAAESPNPKRRAELALALVQEQIRYLFLGMDDGGYVPAGADLTWSRRFGDCKGKAVLLVALLRQLGIQADPVLVHTERGDFVASRLPAMGAFDHVIVRATIAGRTYWMDGTRLGDTRLELLETPPYHVGLPIAQNTIGLVAMTPEQLRLPTETLTLALDATAGIDAPAAAKGEMRFRGTSGTNMRMKYAGLASADRDQQLRELWRKNYDFISPSSIVTSVDDKTGDFVIGMTGTAKMDWYSDVGTRWYEVDRSRLGWKFDTDREGAINKDAPFEIDYPDYWESRETIKLPARGEGFKLQGGSIDQEIGGVYAFHRRVGISGDLVTMESSTRALAPELPASRADQTRSDMSALANTAVFVRLPDEYMATAADIAALQGNKTALVNALRHRGAVHLDRKEFAEGVADEDAAIQQDPQNAMAHAIRALGLAFQNDRNADAAADRAIALDRKQALAWRAKGMVAFSQKRFTDAEANFAQQVALDPADQQALAARASARFALQRFADSLADADAALAIGSRADIRIVRAGALFALNRKDEALAEADRAVESAPTSEVFRKARAEIRLELGKTDLAREDYAALIKQSPSEDYYLARARLWTDADGAKREADIDSAIRLNPKSTKALAFRASAAIQADRLAQAESDIAGIGRIDPDSNYLYRLRLQLFEKQHKARESLALVNTYVAKHPNDAGALNERCWTKVTMNIEVDTALADCNASLKLNPDSPATLDSRAFVNLRLGATDAAIADYDAALKLAPHQSASLYGRAIARSRRGDEQGARSDLLEARTLSPDIDARFATFGVGLPPTLAAAPTQQADSGHSK
jgi:tetratricopeptide (TPR) repeat protein